ncbi:MAG: hypothetical protein RLZZ371_2584, partial [Pseudomonadota bacterium]
ALAGLAPGGAALAAVRPEDLYPIAQDSAGILVKVNSTEFRGREFVGFGVAQDGTELSFRAPKVLEAGAEVMVGANAEAVLVYPGEST